MKSYLITDPVYYTNKPKIFKEKLFYILQQHNIDFICFRDKISLNYAELASIFVTITKKHHIKNIFINQHIDLAYKLKATGVHLTSTQFDQITYAKNLGLKVIISCHNELDIQNAIENKADYITYSPIFNTPNKGKPKGIEQLDYIIKKYNIKIFALGGIVSYNQIKQLNKIKPYGFASIRYFYSKS